MSGNASALNVPVLSYNDTVQAVIETLEDGAVPLIFGPPGVGKTAMGLIIARHFGLELVPMIAREYEAHEISGVMEARDGQLNRHLVGAAKKLIKKGCLGMFDEITASPGPVFANMARVLHERCFGDEKIHKDSLLMAAANPQKQSLDANDMPLPLINRLRIFFMKPEIAEIQNYFSKIGKDGSDLRMAGIEFASILDARPGLLEIEPPKPEICVQENQNWASPRSWERAVTTLAARGDKTPLKRLEAHLTGDLGPGAAQTYMSIRKIYGKLPSVAEIVANPDKARLPNDMLEGVGCLGLIGQISVKDPCAAWVYCNRVQEKSFTGGRECRIALSSALSRNANIPADHESPFMEKARKARVDFGVEQTKIRGKV